MDQRGRIKLGFAPTRRVLATPKAFNKDEARRIKDEIEAKLSAYEGLEIINLNFLNEEGLLFDPNDAPKAAKYFIDSGVDAVFVPHCNFGSEEAVCRLCQAVGKPVLLWGPRDDAPDAQGDRLRDTQCGLFATGKVLRQFRVKFTYIQNCSMDSPVFRRGFENFLQAACMVRHMTHLRIGQLGVRPGVFWSVKANELELMERFGIEIVPITMTDLECMLREHEGSAAVDAEARSLMRRFSNASFSESDFVKLARLKVTLRDWCAQEGLSAVSAQCWKPMDTVAGVAPCFVFSELTGEGLPVICEGDIHGAISSVMALAAARFEARTFLADLTIRHPENDNAELLWHCGVFPHCLARTQAVEPAMLGRHFNRQNPAVGCWELKHGPITLVRFDGMSDDYSVLTAEGQGVEGPETFGTYVWVEFKDWPALERKFVEGPYIHHCAAIHGRYAAAIYEGLKYLPGIKADPVEPTEAQIMEYLK